MSHIKKSPTNVLTATLAAAAVIAAWQFYLFAAFKNPQGAFDAQGGTYHLWAAIGAVLIACVTGFLSFPVSVGYDGRNELHINS